MRQFWTLLLLTAGALAGQTARPVSPARPVAGTSYKDLKYPAAKPVTIPPVETVTLPNGMRLYLLEDHELPVINGAARIRTGNLFDPKDKVGLATMTGMVMRMGGTAKQTGEELDKALEDVAASVESSIAESAGTVSFSALKEDVSPVLAIFHDVLTAPEFRQDQVDLAKAQLHSVVARRNDNAGSIAQREFSDIVYGKDTPYGWSMEHATLDAISRDDVRAFYERCFFPANVRLAIWGDFDSAAMKAEIEKLFADWTVKQEAIPAFPKVAAGSPAGSYLAVKQDTAQTFFTMGHLGGMFNDKDYAALEIMANILGGGAQGRLFQEIRTKLGKAYSVSASWSATYDHPGLLEISASTRSFSTAETIRAVMKELERMRTSEVSDEELKTARETALNSLVFAFDTRTKTLSRMLTYEYYGYPMDFIERYQKAIGEVTRADVLRVAKAQLDPDSFTLVAVGNPEVFDEPLEKLGKPVTAIDLRIAPPARIVVKQTGQQILSHAQQAAGGTARLAAVRDYQQDAEFVLAPGLGGLHVKERNRWMTPDHFRQDSEVPSGKIAAYFDGRQGWIFGPDGEGPLAGSQLSQVKGDLFRLYFLVLLSDHIPGRTVVESGNGAVYITSAGGETARATFNPETGLMKTVSYQTTSAAGLPVDVEEAYSDFRDVDGIKVPFKVSISQGAQPFAEVTVMQVKFNSGLRLADLEQKPAAVRR